MVSVGEVVLPVNFAEEIHVVEEDKGEPEDGKDEEEDEAWPEDLPWGEEWVLLVLDYREDYGVDEAYYIDHDEGNHPVWPFWLGCFGLGFVVEHPEKEDGPESEKGEKKVPDEKGTDEGPGLRDEYMKALGWRTVMT